jgi:hypothetical protein
VPNYILIAGQAIGKSHVFFQWLFSQPLDILAGIPAIQLSYQAEPLTPSTNSTSAVHPFSANQGISQQRAAATPEPIQKKKLNDLNSKE